MKVGIIDIGSNSIRLMLTDNGVTLSKELRSPRISEGLAFTGELKVEKMELATKIISEYQTKAISEGASKVFVFGTEALRAAKNTPIFLDMVKNATGIDIDIVPNEIEAKLGFSGAYSGDGVMAVVDIGGASTEITVGDATSILYSKSLPIGCVRMRDKCGEDDSLLDGYIGEMMDRYGDIVSVDKVVFVAGTASAVATMKVQCDGYNAKLVDNLYITREDLLDQLTLIKATPIERRNEIVGLPDDRIDIMYGGIKLILGILDKLGQDSFYFSDKDNLEGYYKHLIDSNIIA